MQVRKKTLCSMSLVVSIFLPTLGLAAEELSISGQITANGKVVKDLPVAIKNNFESWVFSTNHEGTFSAVIPQKALKAGKYEVFVPNATESIGTFKLVPDPSPWYAPWTKDGYSVVVDEIPVSSSVKIRSEIEVMGFGNVNSLTLDLDVSTK